MAERVKVSLTGMDEVDLGGHREDFAKKVKDIVADIKKRPGVSKKREITIKLVFEPTADPDLCYLTMELGSKIPGFKSDTAKLMIHKNDELSFAGMKTEEEAEE